MHGPAGRVGGRGGPGAGGTPSPTTHGTNVTGQEGLKWSERPRCTAGVALTATDTIASPRAEFSGRQWSRAELLPQNPGPSCAQACPAIPAGSERAAGSSTAPGVRPSLGAGALPGAAFGHFISVFGLVTHSAQTAEKGSIKSKAPSANGRAEPGALNAQTSTSVLTVSPRGAADCSSSAPPSNSGEFQGKAPLGAPEQEAAHTTATAPRAPWALLPSLPHVQVLPPERTSEEPGHPTPSRQLRGLLRTAELAWSEPAGGHVELFHPASPRLFYPRTFKNNGAIQLFKTKVVCFFPVVVGGLVCSCHQDKNERP